MKRDLDLARQMLLDIERHGAESSLELLRNGTAQSQVADERARYHLRLLIDAGLVKEVDRTTAGVPCVRLTNAGHEMIELARSDERWRAAKWIVQEETGGLSLGILRAVLTKWAVQGIARGERYRRVRRRYRPSYYRDYYQGEPTVEPGYRVDSYRYEREPILEEGPIRLGPPVADYRERLDPRERWEHESLSEINEELADGALGVSLPVHMI